MSLRTLDFAVSGVAYFLSAAPTPTELTIRAFWHRHPCDGRAYISGVDFPSYVMPNGPEEDAS